MDYLAIGHVCKDLTPRGPQLGGTVTFAALTARSFGLRVGILTSAPDDMLAQRLLAPLEAIDLACVSAEQFTTFENTYHQGKRTQTLSGQATRLTHEHLLANWRHPAVVHLAPVADEVDPALVEAFPGALIGVTPQGWVRSWDAKGCVSFSPWKDSEYILGQVTATVMSVEDVAGDERYAETLASQAQLMVVTRGAEGCTLFWRGERVDIPAPRVPERDPTGAGDIFAAAFFIRLRLTRDPVEAAHFATRLASASVTRVGLDSIPAPDEVRVALGETTGE